MVAGLDTPSEGEVLLQGDKGVPVRIQMVFQDGRQPERPLAHRPLYRGTHGEDDGCRRPPHPGD